MKGQMPLCPFSRLVGWLIYRMADSSYRELFSSVVLSHNTNHLFRTICSVVFWRSYLINYLCIVFYLYFCKKEEE